jgi:hypothetical protein
LFGSFLVKWEEVRKEVQRPLRIWMLYLINFHHAVRLKSFRRIS